MSVIFEGQGDRTNKFHGHVMINVPFLLYMAAHYDVTYDWLSIESFCIY